ncbi:hypothetical protein I4U23_024487 [Adineta vaga]|nr:hypothetical protein I4U23_024487 [Adineta vaga]
MKFLCYILIFLIPFSFSYPRQYPNDLNNLLQMYLKQRETMLDTSKQKFGSPRQNLFRVMPIHYQQLQIHNPTCLPQVWTCGPGLPLCCPGLMCYDGNAKRGRYCVARG